ncbi:MAG: carboxypeptidase regulatory-like domain-containing protein [Lacibacter sp.]
MIKIKNLLLVTVTVLMSLASMAQVTTSSVTGTVKSGEKDYLEGATVTAIHNPSGTTYATISKKGGIFNLPGLRVGGPYTIKIEFVGQKPKVIENVYLQLGEAYNIEAELGVDQKELSTVVVTGLSRKRASDKSGVSTNVGQAQITTLPTISRSITDFTRLTPQANGNSFAGRDGRFNNLTVDGANLNNNFGLSTDPLPGGGNQPISLDAIEEVSINITPYDVRQSNFTGANIAAVTKSGTNKFKGSAYGFFRNQDFNGTQVNNYKVSALSKTQSEIYGGTLGGPIVKNKLFFFVNAEFEKRTNPPGTSYSPTGGSGTGTTSSVKIDSLAKLSNYLKSAYNYETGAYDNFPNFQSQNRKILARIDWNISRIHKLTAKYNELVSNNDVALNAQSVPNSATSGTNTWTSQARFGANAMSFANSNYGFEDIVRSAALELNSIFRGKFSNQFIATYTKISATRTSPSQVFPFVDIIGPTAYSAGGRNNYMSFGYEPYSYNNDVQNKILNVTDNFTLYAGKHTLTAGISYEHQFVGNMFMPASQSYYTYGSLAEFMNPASHPIAFALTYSRIAGKDAVYSAEMKIGQASAYAQDEFNITPKFKLTYGIRFDKPVYPSQPLENPSITALTFPGKDGSPTHYSTGMWPKSTLYASPRIGFRWNVEDEKLIVRGGTGIYTGKLPFVYLTNMPSNSGMYQVQALANATQLSQITFNADPQKWQSLFTAPTPTPNSGGFVLIDPDFKFPQVWRTNIGFEKRMGDGWNFSMDGIFSKDLRPVVMRNANETTPSGTVNLGGSSRPSFTSTSTSVRRLYSAYANAIVLENAKTSDVGMGVSITTQLSKAMTNGFFGSIAYTYSLYSDLTSNPGSQASSTWQNNPTSGTQNTKELALSSFSVPHRIVANLSYRKEYLKNLSSTISLFYEGAIQGTFSYIYGSASGTAPSGYSNTADINYDGNSQDLMYIPKKASEITFTPVTVNGVTYTAQQQSDLFFKFLAQDKYLSKHMGQVAERNGARYPFYHRVDLKFVQEVFKNIGNSKNTLQVTFDCLNFLNLLSKNWGTRDFFIVNNPLRATKSATTGAVLYQLATYTPTGSTTPQFVDRTFIKNVSTTSTYSFQIGVRYLFN